MNKKMKPICLTIALLLILSLGIAAAPYIPALAAETIHVDAANTGDSSEDGTAAHPFDSIQEGINAASSGDTVLVYEGTYYEAITISIDITVEAYGEAANTIIDATESGSSAVTITAGDVVFEGFTVRNGELPSSGIHIDEIASGESIVIEDCVVTNNVGYGIYSGNIGGELTVQDCTIGGAGYGNSDSGIYLAGPVSSGGSVTIDSNEISYNGDDGIAFSDSISGTVTIEDNTIAGNSGDGIYTTTVYGTLNIHDGTIEDNSNGIRVVSVGSTGTVNIGDDDSDNGDLDIYTNGRGIVIGNAGNYAVNGGELNILGCNVDSNYGYGLYFYGVIASGSEVLIDNNTFTDSVTGIQVDNYSHYGDITISNNNVSNNNTLTTGIHLDGHYYGAVDLDNNTITNNNGDGISIYFVGDTLTIRNGEISGNTSDGIEIYYVGASASVTIRDVAITDNDYYGIIFDYYVSNYASVTIQDNEITDNDYAGICFYTDSYPYTTVTIQRNEITGNGGSSDDTGIYFGSIYGEVTISDNDISDNYGVGIYIYYVGDTGMAYIDCNTISGNSAHGVYIYEMYQNNWVDMVGCNDIFDNSGYGVYNASGYEIDASENWWGDVSGPSGEGPGSGDAVSADVVYDDWLYGPCGENAECGDLSASISPSVTTGEAPLTVQFYGYASNSDVDWKWSFGTGETSTSRSPACTFQNEGTYTVTLKVTDECEQTASATVTILVEGSGATGAPDLTVTSLNVSPTYIYPGDPVQVKATVNNYGGSWGSGNMLLLVNGYLEQQDGVGLAAGSSETVAFTLYRTEPGEYQVTFGDAAATFFVMETADSSSETPGPFDGGPLDTGGIIAIICICVILLGGIVLVFLFARRT